MVFIIEMNIVCLDSQLTMTRIMSQPDDENSFLMKSIKIEFQSHLGIESCLSNLYSL